MLQIEKWFLDTHRSATITLAGKPGLYREQGLPMAETNQPKGTQTILVVDDDPSILLLCSTKLQQAGFTVLQATGSSEALKACSDFPGQIDLLVSDLLLPPQAFSFAASNNQFPRVHGHLLAGRLMAMKKGVRVLLMSALSDKELDDHDITIGSLPFLRKPFTMETLLGKVKEVLAAPLPDLGKNAPAAGTEGEQKDIHWYD